MSEEVLWITTQNFDDFHQFNIFYLFPAFENYVVLAKSLKLPHSKVTGIPQGSLTGVTPAYFAPDSVAQDRWCDSKWVPS